MKGPIPRLTWRPLDSLKTQLVTFPPNLLSRSAFQGVAPPTSQLPKLDTWESFWAPPLTFPHSHPLIRLSTKPTGLFFISMGTSPIQDITVSS